MRLQDKFPKNTIETKFERKKKKFKKRKNEEMKYYYRAEAFLNLKAKERKLKK